MVKKTNVCWNFRWSMIYSSRASYPRGASNMDFIEILFAFKLIWNFIFCLVELHI